MGFLGFFNYSKAGPGVDKNAPKKKRFFFFWELYFRKFWKLLQLNLLFLLFCLPIVTIGPAIAGMTYVLRQFALEKPVFLFSDFWTAFKSNWKQGVLLSLIQGVVYFLIGVADYYYFTQAIGQSWLRYIPLGVAVLVTAVILFMSFYPYLMAVTVELPIQHIIKNSFIFAFLGAKTNFITLFWVLLLVVLQALFFPLTLPIIVSIGLSTICFITVYNSYPYLQRYIIEPQQVNENEDEEDEDEEDEDGDEPIFTDIGSAERPAEMPKKSSGGGKVIR